MGRVIIMDSGYSATEVLEIAEKIEHYGAVFYRRAAELFSGEQNREFLLGLAEWEVRHEKIFADMRRQVNEDFAGNKVFDPETYMTGNAKLMASLSVFAITPNPSQILMGLKDKSSIIKRALKLEKDTIVFYQGLKNFAKDAVAVEQIGKIIEEEQRHINILNQSLEQL